MHKRIDRRRVAMVNLANHGFQDVSKRIVSANGSSSQSGSPFQQTNRPTGMGMAKARQSASGSAGS